MKSLMKIWKNENIDFYELLKKQTEKTCLGVQKLSEFCENKDPIIVDEIVAIEREGDVLRRSLIDGINKTFITPFEREDIFSLSRTIDNILDYSRTTAERIYDFNVDITSDIKLFVSEIFEMSKFLKSAISNLENDMEKATESAIQIKKIENKIENHYRVAVAELFELDDIKQILKLRELYRHLSNAADKGDEAADLLCNIIIKSA